MRHLYRTIFIILSAAIFNPAYSKTVDKERPPVDFLKKLNGQYPSKAKLFGHAAFAQRLKKLLGNNRYVFLRKTWAVETPMKFAHNLFVASACQAHNCAATNFIIAFDFSRNVMYAGIKENDQVKTYSEDGSQSPTLKNWENKH